MFKEVRHGSSLVRLIGLIPDELPAADRTARSPCGLLVQPRGHFAIGTSGAANAALFAVAMLAGDDAALRAKLDAYRARQTDAARAMTADLK